MTKQTSLKSDGVVALVVLERGINDSMNAPDFSPNRHQATIESNLSVASLTRVQLNLEDLKCFEVVERQFQRWGVLFCNCIAIRPSNPAFPAHSGSTVLMGAPKSGWLEATFLQPIRRFSAFVTSSQRLVLSAYDSNNQRIAHAQVMEPNLAGADSPISPNTQLIVEAPNIYRITFCAFDGQFTVDDLGFEL